MSSRNKKLNLYAVKKGETLIKITNITYVLNGLILAGSLIRPVRPFKPKLFFWVNNNNHIYSGKDNK